MEKDQALDGYQEMTKEEYEELTKKLDKNKLQFFRILEENPKVGVYANETREDWDRFFTFYINFLKSQTGPRGECAKKVRAQLLQREDQINKVLLPFKQNASTHIREIFMKHKFFVPCKEYTDLLKIEEANAKFISNLERLRDPNGPMVKSIVEGLRAKHGDQYDFEEQLKQLQQNYIIKIEEAQKEIVLLKEAVDKCQAYHQYMRVKQTLDPYFKAWVEVDSKIGRESVKTGSEFQEKVMRDMIPYLIYRERAYPNWKYSDKKIEVFTNASWIPKNLGEIDIAFGYKDQTEDRYFIFALIECKSRLFDLREAYKQVSLDDQVAVDKGPTLAELKEMKKLKQMTREKMMKNKTEKNEGPKPEQPIPLKESQPEQQKKKEEPKPAFNINKKFLSTKYGPAELVSDHHFYIITTLPQNDFVLPIQSKMKDGIQRHTKNLFTEDIQSQPLYQRLLERFKEVKSPLEWIRLHEQRMKGEGSNILVLN